MIRVEIFFARNSGKKVTIVRSEHIITVPASLDWEGGIAMTYLGLDRDMSDFRSRITGRAGRAVLLGATSALVLTVAGTGSVRAQAVCELTNGATGTQSVNGSRALACGQGATADGDRATAIGSDSLADGLWTTAIGSQAKAIDKSSIAIGREALANGERSISVGAMSGAASEGTRNIFVGTEAGQRTKGDKNTAVGDNSGQDVEGNENSALGSNSGSRIKEFANPLAGQDNQPDTLPSEGNSVVGANSGNDITGNRNAAFGYESGNWVEGDNNVAFGAFAGSGTPDDPLAVSNTVAIGTNARASGNNATAIGRGSRARGGNSLALGRDTEANGPGAVAIGTDSDGNGAVATRENQFVLGTENHTYTAPGITSGASRAFQQGPLEVVTTDAAGNLASDGGLLFDELSKMGGGVAIAMALENPDLVGNERFGLAGNVAFWEDNVALGFTAMGVLGNNFLGAGERWALSGGVGFTVKEDSYGGRKSQSSVGGRAGLQVSW